MKLVSLLLLVGTLHVSARSWSQSVTYDGKNVGLETIFKEVERQTGFVVFYDYRQIKNAKPVTINAKNEPLNSFLDRCFKGQPFGYAIEDKSIVITPGQAYPKTDGADLPPPAADVKGRVINENGEPVAGVTVTVKNSDKKSITNDKGEFFLPGVNRDDVLEFTHVSMISFSLAVDGRTEFTVTLKTKISSLGKVTVSINTGYQQINKERFVGSYAQLDSQSFHRRPGMGIIERLDGTVPGVLFDKKGGTSLPAIQIRGLSTLGFDNTPSDPLIVVDNFPMPPSFDLSNINPNDVESVTVLKDAAAASIWGARAGNGVIVITTRKGNYGQKFHLDISSNVMVQDKADLYYYKRISVSDFIDIEKDLFSKGYYDDALNNTDTRPVVSPVVEILDRQRSGLITDAEAASQINALRNNDVRRELNEKLYRRPVQIQNYVGFSGGNSQIAYQFSLGYNRNMNDIQGSKGMDRWTINTNAGFHPVKDLEIRTGIELAQNNDRSVSYGTTYDLYPYAQLSDANGHALVVPHVYRMGFIDTVGGGQLLDWHYRPLDEIRLANQSAVSKFARLNLAVNYQLTSWLSASVAYQYALSITDRSNYQDVNTYYTRDLINKFTDVSQTDPQLKYPVPNGGIIDFGTEQFKNYNLRGSFNFRKNFGSDHQISGILGGEISDSKGGYSSYTRLYGYDDATGTFRDNIDFQTYHPQFFAANPGAVALIPYNDSYVSDGVNRFVSLLANMSYIYRNRYTLYASARRDGANVFGINANNKWKPLWSVGAGWELSKESFYKVSWMPYLKLRGSFGYTGNTNNTLSGRLLLSQAPNQDQLTGMPYNYPVRAPNPNLKWEEVRIINTGVDFGLLRDRINGSLEVFQKRASQVISNAPLPPSSGVSTYELNYANMKTNGYELTLNSKNTTGVVQWTTNLGFSRAKTIVTKIYTTTGVHASDYLGYGLTAVAGRVAYGMASYRWAGLDPATGDPQGYYQGQASKDYSAIFNDSVQNQVFNGSALPLGSGFLRNNVSWHGFTLSVNITGRFGYYFREPALTLDYKDNMTQTFYGSDYYRRWQKPGDEAHTEVPSTSYPVVAGMEQRSSFYQYASIHVKKGDNIRLQDVRLSWQWVNRRNIKLPFQSMQLFLYSNNLNVVLWRAAKSYYDPDFTGGGGSTVIAGPTPKTWTAGITLNL